MCAGEAERELGVARQRRVENALMFGVDIARHGAARDGHAPVALGVLVEQRVEAVQPRRRARRDQGAVEIPVPLLELRRSCDRILAQALLGLGKAVECSDDFGLPNPRRPLRSPAAAPRSRRACAPRSDRESRSIEAGATRNPRWPSAVTNASPSSRVNASRTVEPLIDTRSRSSSVRNLRPARTCHRGSRDVMSRKPSRSRSAPWLRLGRVRRINRLSHRVILSPSRPLRLGLKAARPAANLSRRGAPRNGKYRPFRLSTTFAALEAIFASPKFLISDWTAFAIMSHP